MKLKNQKKSKEKEDYVYLIKVDGKTVWKGLRVKSVFEKIQRQNPDKKVSLSWELKEGILIV